jgi:hypothetical protein
MKYKNSNLPSTNHLIYIINILIIAICDEVDDYTCCECEIYMRNTLVVFPFWIRICIRRIYHRNQNFKLHRDLYAGHAIHTSIPSRTKVCRFPKPFPCHETFEGDTFAKFSLETMRLFIVLSLRVSNKIRENNQKLNILLHDMFEKIIQLCRHVLKPGRWTMYDGRWTIFIYSRKSKH